MGAIKRVAAGAPTGGRFDKHDRDGFTGSLSQAPDGPRILITVQPQQWIDDVAIDSDPAFDVDVTDLVAAMPAAQRAALSDNSDSSDDLYLAAVSVGLAPAHNGPMRVEVRDSLDEFNAQTEPRILITVQPQQWIDDVAIDSDPAFDVDVTDLVSLMPAAQRAALSDNSDSSDDLYLTAVSVGLAPAHDGPMRVEVRDSLDEFEVASAAALAEATLITGDPSVEGRGEL